MKFTVGDLMKIPPLSSGKVVAGHGGLDRAVKSVSVLEVPHLTDFNEPDQLEISAFYSISDDVEAQLDVIKRLNERGISGLILFHVGHYLKYVPAPLIAMCNELDFPLIVASASTAYSDIITVIIEMLHPNKDEQLAYKLQVYDKMRDLLSSGRGIGGVIKELSNLIDKEVYFYNYSSVCLAYSHNKFTRDVSHSIKTVIKRNLSVLIDKGQNVLTTPSEEVDSWVLFCPIVSAAGYSGVMVVLGANDLSHSDEIAISQAKSTLGIVLLGKVSAKDHSSAILKNFITDLVNWDFPSEDAAAELGEVLGVFISKVKVCAIIGFVDEKEADHDETFNKRQLRLLHAAEAGVGTLFSNSIVTCLDDKIMILFSTDMQQDDAMKPISAFCTKLIETIEKSVDARICSGVGGYCKALIDIRRSYKEALFAFNIAKNVYNSQPAVEYADFQLFALICDAIDREKINEVKGLLFEPVITYDRKNNSQLFTTFTMLLQCDLNTTLVAEKMFLHKNTVLQRKRKIAELYSYDPFDTPYYLNFKCALALEQMLAN